MWSWSSRSSSFFFNDTATTEIYTLCLRDALPICGGARHGGAVDGLIESQYDLKSKEIKLFCRGFKDADQFEPFAVRCEPELIETEDGQQEVLAVKERIQGTSGDEILNERPTETEAHGRTFLKRAHHELT